MKTILKILHFLLVLPVEIHWWLVNFPDDRGWKGNWGENIGIILCLTYMAVIIILGALVITWLGDGAEVVVTVTLMFSIFAVMAASD